MQKYMIPFLAFVQDPTLMNGYKKDWREREIEVEIEMMEEEGDKDRDEAREKRNPMVEKVYIQKKYRVRWYGPRV